MSPDIQEKIKNKNLKAKIQNLPFILIHLPFKIKCIIYGLILGIALFLIFFSTRLLNQSYCLVICLIPIIFSGLTLGYKTVWITTGILMVNYSIFFFIYQKASLKGELVTNLVIFILYLIIGLQVHKVTRLYHDLGKELLTKQNTEKLLEEEKNWFRVTLLSIGDGIITTDSEKKIIFMNYQAERISGWALDEAQGEDASTVYKIFNEETGEMIKDPIDRIMKRGFIVGLANHTILVTKKGKEIPIGDSGAPIKDTTGKILGFVITFRDVSAKKIMQKELRHAQAQAIQAEKMAGIGQLAAGVAHEINNPLGYISSNLDTLTRYISNLSQIVNMYKTRKPNQKIKQREEELKINYILRDLTPLLQENKEGIVKITEIVKNLKDFAKVNPRAEWTEIDLGRIIRNVLLVVRNELKFAADTELNLADDAPVACNVTEINQVILNLTLNAIHAIKKKFGEKKGKITLTTVIDGKQVICRIEDNGCGIPQENLARIFEPFYTTREPGEGTGLGLYIVFDILVKKHNGEISVNSKEGEGTCFTFKLPLAPVGWNKSISYALPPRL